MIWTQEIIPEGWLECNGQTVNKTLYPELYKLMTKTPNYQGMFLRGAGSQTINHGSYGNVTHQSILGVIQKDAVRNVVGQFSTEINRNKAKGLSGPFYYDNKRAYTSVFNNFDPSGWDEIIEFDLSRTVPTAEENRPVNIGVKYIIKAE